MATVSKVSWAKSLLNSLEVPVTDSNIKIIVGWENAEGGAGPQFGIPKNIAAYNPLNTTQPMTDPPSKDTPGNTPPVQAYNSWAQGLKATLITLLQPGVYTALVDMLQRGDATPTEAANTIGSSKWGTSKTNLANDISCAAFQDDGLVVPSVKPGGVAGLGGTGTPANTTQISPWIVGDSTNPDQDYWTTINQYAQEGQLYLFADGETLYLADGYELMAQTPALVIHRADSRVLSLNLIYDNTSWMFATTHRVKVGVQRRATLSRMTAPTQATLKLVCDIDDYRGGDVIYLLGCGTLGGLWLVGDCLRGVFDPFSTLTLVKGSMPLSAITGESIGPNLAPVKTASKAGSGAVVWAMIAYATALNSDNYPYVWGGGHVRAGFASIGTPGGNGYNGTRKGFDCSGAVGAVLAAAGMGISWAQPVPGDSGIISTLIAAGLLHSGQGSGPVEVTLFDNPGVHIFMRINGSYFGSEDGSGHLPSNGYGIGWIKDGVEPGPPFEAYHIKQNVLRGYIAGSNAGSNYAGVGG